MIRGRTGGSQVFRMGAMMLVDVVIVWISTVLAYWVRFGGMVTETFSENMGMVAAAASVVFVVLFFVFKLYHQVWRHVSVDMVVKLATAVAIGLGILTGANFLLTDPGEMRPAPLGVLFGLGVLVFVGSTAIRAFGRLILYFQAQGDVTGHGVVIIGAGDAGVLLLRDIENQPELRLHVIGFLDDDLRKHKCFIRGVRVLGSIDDLADVVEERGIEEAMIAIPSAHPDQRRHILDRCAEIGLKTRIMGQLAIDSDAVGVSNMRKVEVEDLLGREAVHIDIDRIAASLGGKVVAVTGAAGSIGLELCRQIVLVGPSKLVMIEMDESRLYETFLEIQRLDESVPVMAICDIRDAGKLERIFEREQPQVVLHAAAYKHVPLMEMAPDEAVKTNVLGSRNVIAACERYGVEHFILISTDKAVAPSSVMGLTKAIAERQLLSACRRGLRGSAVRFGNVLGSRGSVVPLFEEQLRKGGPLRVTHPDVTRYFMTIPEAARLVLQAQAISHGGELFVLDMGEPVKIVDLARTMIAVSGVETDVEFMGLRPAEKMHEILIHSEEDLLDTGSEKILRVNALPVTADDFEGIISDLIAAAVADDRVRIKDGFHRLMPDYVGFGENRFR